MTSKRLDCAYQFARDISERAHGQLNGKSFPPNLRSQLAAASLHLALEHQHAMNILAKEGDYGSMLALARCAAEAFARGYWIFYLSDDQQLDNFSRGRYAPSLEVLLRKLVDDNPHGPRREDMQRIVQRLNAFNHGSVEHLAHRMGKSISGPQYSVELISTALEFGAWIASMAAVDIAGAIIGDDQSAQQMLTDFKSMSRSYGATLEVDEESATYSP